MGNILINYILIYEINQSRFVIVSVMRKLQQSVQKF